MQRPQMLREKFDHFLIWANNTQHVPTRRNMVAKRAHIVAPNNVAMSWSFGRGIKASAVNVCNGVAAAFSYHLLIKNSK